MACHEKGPVSNGVSAQYTDRAALRLRQGLWQSSFPLARLACDPFRIGCWASHARG